MRRKSKRKLLTLDVIRAASKGDYEAMDVVLRHYEGYILKLSIRRMYDEEGQLHYYVDETLKGRLETKLIEKVLDFKIA